MSQTVVNLQNVYGTKEPYVMVSCVKMLNGLLILQPFEKKKIQCSM